MELIAVERNDIKKQLDARGMSIADWAKEHGFKRHQVYAVLSGRTPGHRGMSHRIAVALGLTESASFAGDAELSNHVQGASQHTPGE